ncbi:MAG TPA: 30S ribosomal protein S4, partial [Clostridia bacterium]|nr:30S ribosomal protein S4 [Clostridia bacterium]
YLVKIGDTIKVAEKSASSPKFKELAEGAEHRTPPAWLEVDVSSMEGKVLAFPSREEIDTNIEEHLIVELYSK